MTLCPAVLFVGIMERFQFGHLMVAIRVFEDLLFRGGSGPCAWQAKADGLSALQATGMRLKCRISPYSASAFTWLCLDNNHWVLVTLDGNWTGSEGAESEFCYLIETDSGVERLDAATIDERLSWQQDASRVPRLFVDLLPSLRSEE